MAASGAERVEASGSESEAVAGPPPASAAAVFGARLSLAHRYAELLATAGIERGLLGPREAPRIWTRHLLNCAAVADLLPDGARVVDVGSGAGLPGLVLAIRRPDLQVDLVESLRRRTDYLSEVVTELGLRDSVRVVHGRAEDPVVVAAVGNTSWVVARAVAALDRLAQWCLPLLQPGGVLLALKGENAKVELDEQYPRLRRLGATSARVIECGGPSSEGPASGEDSGSDPTIVVAIRRGDRRPETRKVSR